MDLETCLDWNQVCTSGDEISFKVKDKTLQVCHIFGGTLEYQKPLGSGGKYSDIFTTLIVLSKDVSHPSKESY